MIFSPPLFPRECKRCWPFVDLGSYQKDCSTLPSCEVTDLCRLVDQILLVFQPSCNDSLKDKWSKIALQVMEGERERERESEGERSDIHVVKRRGRETNLLSLVILVNFNKGKLLPLYLFLFLFLIIFILF